ncbi:hypothetical protein Tco_0173808 [Tanacetum coccineum]
MTNILAKEMIGLSFPPTMVSKVKVLRVFEMIEHDGRAFIYGAFMSVDTNDILTNDKFPILDIWRKIISEDNGLEVGSIRRIQGLDTAYWGFLRVGTTLDIFQNIHILYLRYGVLGSSGYGVLGFIPLWSLVSAGTDTPYLP